MLVVCTVYYDNNVYITIHTYTCVCTHVPTKMIDNQRKQRLLLDPLFKTHHPQEWKTLVELSRYMDSTAQWTDMNATDIKVCTQLYSREAEFHMLFTYVPTKQ